MRSTPRYGWGRAGTAVTCPSCAMGALEVRFSCLGSDFVCSDCRAVFELADLVALLDESDFESLARVVESRLSDRV